VGPQGGIKFFVHNNAFLNLGYRYEIFFSRIEAIEDNKSRETTWKISASDSRGVVPRANPNFTSPKLL
jgi:hypothetical protein